MSSLLFNSFIDDVARGNIDLDTDTFFFMLVTSAYAPDKDAHTKRSDVTNEVTGTGYTAGGKATAATVTKDLVNDKVTVAFAPVNWPTSTITARGGVLYKKRGGLASADEVVGYVDFGADITSTADTFTVTFSTPITFQN